MEGTDLPNIEREVRDNTAKAQTVQPYMILVDGQCKQSIITQGDGWFISIPDKADLIVGFDILHKIYHVFNLSYPIQLQHFYNFIDCYIFDMPTKKHSVVSSLQL